MLMDIDNFVLCPLRRPSLPLVLVLLFLAATHLCPPVAVVCALDWPEATINILSEKRLSIAQLNKMLKTEMESEVSDFDDETADLIWRRATAMEWSRLLEKSDDGRYMAPMVLCHSGAGLSGMDRLRGMHELLLAVDPDVDTYLEADDGSTTHVVYNGADLTCAITRLPVVVAADAAFSFAEWFIVQPVVSLTKIVGNSVENMEKKYNLTRGDDVDVTLKEGTGIDGDVLDNLGKDELLEGSTAAPENGGSDRDGGGGPTVPPRVNILLCRGVVDAGTINNITLDIATNEGKNVKDFLLDKTGEGSSQISQLLFGPGGFHNVTAAEDVEVDLDGGGDEKQQSRRAFWEEAFKQGIDREDGYCDRLIEAMDVGFSAQSEVLTLDLPTAESEEAIINETVAYVASAADLNHLLADGEAQLKVELRELSRWCGLSLLAGVALLDTVCAIEVEPEMRVGNRQSSWLMQSGIQDNHQFHEMGLNGSGQVVAVSDTGLDVDNCYFWDSRDGFSLDGSTDTSRRKVVQYYPYINDQDYEYGHGTHVCGTVAGKKAVDGINESEGMADGVAPGAKLAFVDIGSQDGSLAVPVPASDLLEAGSDAGCRLHSASWGSDSNDYGFNARTFDDYIYKTDNFLLMVAAGNAGRDGFNTVGDPATAKNIISVGASHSADPDLSSGMLGPPYIADFSSKGSTGDGRTKPDIVAPGKYILSAGAQPSETGECDPLVYPPAGGRGGGVLSISGTSMATPGVSGIAAIVRQYFSQGWYPSGVKNETDIYNNPSGAAIKAVIMNGAQPINGVDTGRGNVQSSREYDNIQNFGRVSLIDSLYLPGKTNVDLSLFDRQSVSNGQIWNNTFTIDKSKGCQATQLSVTLVWSDPPGSVGCRRCLVNDIDLYVTKAGESTTYYPNGLNGPDDVNNAERVRLAANNGEQFTAYVKGTNLITSRQSFAVVATGCFGGVANELDQSQNVYDNDDSSDKTTTIIIGVVVGVVGAVIVGGVITYFVRRSR